MAPKVKVSKEDIVNAAFSLIREKGSAALNARTIAAALGCSTQPIFSNFASMEELRAAVEAKAAALYDEYMAREEENSTRYKAGGMAYIRFAKEEKELFKLFFMCDRDGEPIPENDPLSNEMTSLVHNNLGLSQEDAKLFHMEMWIYVHGIATMLATGFWDISWELIGRMLTDAYMGLRKQYGLE